MKSGIRGAVSKQDEAGQRIGREDERQKGDGHERGERHLGQILAEVGVQRLDPLDRGVDQFAGALARV